MESLAYSLAYLLHNDLPWSSEQQPGNVLDNDHIDNGAAAAAVAAVVPVTATVASIPSSSIASTTINNDPIDVAASPPTTTDTINPPDRLNDSDRDTQLIQQVLRMKQSCRNNGHLRTPVASLLSAGMASDDDLCGADKVISVSHHTSHNFLLA